MKSLKEMEGEKIVLISPIFKPALFEEVTLLRLEDAGIWIESQTTTELVLHELKQSMAPRTIVWFLPWHQVTMIMGSLDVPSIGSRAFE